MKGITQIWLVVAAVLLFSGGIAFAQWAAGTNYTEPGGARTVVQGSLDVASGGDLDMESGSTFRVAGTARTLPNITIGASPAATCTSGIDIHIDTDETVDTNCTTTADNSLCVCVATDTWATTE